MEHKPLNSAPYIYKTKTMTKKHQLPNQRLGLVLGNRAGPKDKTSLPILCGKLNPGSRQTLTLEKHLS